MSDDASGTELDLDQLRADTPGCAAVAHLNNAGSSLPTQRMLDAQIGHINLEARIGGYEAAADQAEASAAVYDSIAALIGGRREEIALLENATRAWDSAVYGFGLAPGDRVLVGRSEYSSNVLGLLHLARRRRIELVLIPDDEHGQISLDHLADELSAGAEMVSLSHMPTSGGLVNPAAAVGALCAEHDTFFMLDACQSVGQMPIDVEAIGCQALAATGRKYLRAPRGTGFLWVAGEWMERIEPTFLDQHAGDWVADESYVVHSDGRRFETWEGSVANKLGLGAAVDYALDVDITRTWPRIQQLAHRLRAGLEALPGITVHDKGQELGGIVVFGVDGKEAAEVQAQLRAEAVHTSVSPSATARYDLVARGLPDLVRASVHYYNTEEEVDRLLNILS